MHDMFSIIRHSCCTKNLRLSQPKRILLIAVRIINKLSLDLKFIDGFFIHNVAICNPFAFVFMAPNDLCMIGLNDNYSV